VNPSEQAAGVEKPREQAEEIRGAGDGSVAPNSAGATADPPQPSTPASVFQPLKEQAERWREVLEPKPLRASYHVRSGVSVALIIVLTALGYWVFSSIRVLRPFIPHTAIGLMLCAVALYFLQRRKPGTNLSEDYVLHFYQHPRYWSFIVLISAGLIFTLCSALLVVGKMQPLPQPMVQQPIVEPPAPTPEPVQFPALTVTGVVLNGLRSSAIINGDTVYVGEYIEGVKLVEVAAEGVVVEMQGSQEAFSLGSASTHVEPTPARGE